MSSRKRLKEQVTPAVPTGCELCAGCWTEVPRGTRSCPVCGASTEELSSRGYEEKLSAALVHPIGEVRERAATLLGRVGGPHARERLLDLAENSSDHYLAAAALKGLYVLSLRLGLPPIDWGRFAGSGHPLQVRFEAVAILRAEAARLRRASGSEAPR